MAPASNHKIKLWLHTCAFFLMVPVLGIALYMMMNPVMLAGAKRTPMASRVGMSMAGKGLMFLLYQILTENVRAFKRFASTKANMILNCIEAVAWPAAAGVTVYGILQFCIGISCTLSYILIPLCVVLAGVSGFSAWISIKEHKVFKATGQKPGDMKLETMNSEDSNKAFNAGGNGVSIHQVAVTGKTPEPLQHSYSGSGRVPTQGQHSGFGTPQNQQRQHYNHNQSQHVAHNQPQYYQQPQQQGYGGARR